MFWLRLKIIGGVAGLVFVMFNMGGCISTSIGELEEYIAEVQARPGGRIEPLPEFKPYVAYAYQSGQSGARDPFKLFYQKKQRALSPELQDVGLTEAMANELRKRNKEELEGFELDSLRMVGTMSNEDGQLAIIRDPDGVVHTVTVGNYLGRNIGKILDIFENKLDIREIVQDSQGRWEERQAAIVLDQQE